ncbi:MAG: GNAT family N-acetyltransferase [Clostridiaceae bacterium]|jgi:ribosomal protein S18 acetylase RimI-like enzyme|nr:GNAT family N-acetyltransferase [Clostridiaceae bacterium]
MIFRKALLTDINGIMNIIRQAQEFFRENGIEQWQNNYPNEETVADDIKHYNGYVLVKGNDIIGTVAVLFQEEKSYGHIEGKWLSDGQYATVHRIAVAGKYKGKGYASDILRNIEEMCRQKNIFSIRVDTHEKNIAMQKLLDKNGFIYCGIIYLEDGSKRNAYEKIIEL